MKTCAIFALLSDLKRISSKGCGTGRTAYKALVFNVLMEKTPDFTTKNVKSGVFVFQQPQPSNLRQI